MLRDLNEVSELDSVQVTEPQENKCDESSDHVSSSQNGSNVLAFLRRNAFVTLTMVGVALGSKVAKAPFRNPFMAPKKVDFYFSMYGGIGLGFALRHINISAREIRYLTFPGELMIRILQMLVLPLIISSVITGISTVDKKVIGKIGLRCICFYTVTTLIASFTGIALVVLIQPGHSSKTTLVSSSGDPEAGLPGDAFLDLLRNMIPSNLVEACFRQHKTVYSRRVSTEESLGLINMTNNSDKNDSVPVRGTIDGMNVLGLLVFSIAFGLILGSMETEGKPLRDLFDCLNKAIMRLISIVMWYCPVGILFLLAGQIVNMTDTGEIGRTVSLFCVTIITGMLIHSFISLPLIYFLITRKNPLRLMAGILHALSTAFGTSSSSATLPVTLQCMEQNLNMDKRVTRFMLPIGATLNMDGSALYLAVAALFIAQINNMDLNMSQYILLSLIVTATSSGASGIPHFGVIYLVIVLTSVGLPTKDVSLILIFDWILQRLETMTNVLGDCIGVGVVQHLSRNELQRFPL